MRVCGVVSVIANVYYVLSGHITYTSSPDAHNKQSISWAQLLTPFEGEGKEASSSVEVGPGCLARLFPALGACMCACAAKGQLQGELVSKPVISIHPLPSCLGPPTCHQDTSLQIHLSPSLPMALGQAPSFSSGFQPLPLYLCLPLSLMHHPSCCPRAALRPHSPLLFALSSGGTSTNPPPGFLSPMVSGSGSPPQLPSLLFSDEDQPHDFPHQPCSHAHLYF